MRQGHRSLFFADIAEADTEKRKDLVEIAFVNNAKTVELTEVGRKLAVLNLGEPVVR